VPRKRGLIGITIESVVLAYSEAIFTAHPSRETLDGSKERKYGVLEMTQVWDDVSLGSKGTKEYAIFFISLAQF